MLRNGTESGDMMKLSKKIGDRIDGYRVKNVEPFFLIIPYVMKTRVDSHVYFSDDLDITELEKFIWEHQKDIPGLKLYHLIIAAAVRVYSQRPYLNRFVIDSKIYARKQISVSLTMKRGMGVNDDETVVKPVFEPESTLYDVVNKFNELVEANRSEITENDTDNVAKIIGHLPHWFVKLVVNTLMFMDKKNCMPSLINRVSPFHTGFFITNMGSIGVEPIYHHIYEFGTTSIFAAIGKKRTVNVVGRDGQLVRKRYMGIKVVADERICNGHYYAESARLFMKLIQNPEKLLVPPENVVIDKGIHKLAKRKMTYHDGEKEVTKMFETDGKYKTH